MDNIALLIRKDLHLNVARLCEILLDENRRIAECRGCSSAGLCDCFIEFRLVVDNRHTNTAAAGRSLHNNRIANGFRKCLCLIVVCGLRPR